MRSKNDRYETFLLHNLRKISNDMRLYCYIICVRLLIIPPEVPLLSLSRELESIDTRKVSILSEAMCQYREVSMPCVNIGKQFLPLPVVLNIRKQFSLRRFPLVFSDGGADTKQPLGTRWIQNPDTKDTKIAVTTRWKHQMGKYLLYFLRIS